MAVLVRRDGRQWHSNSECSVLAGDRDLEAITTFDAIKRRLSPCPNCGVPEGPQYRPAQSQALM